MKGNYKFKAFFFAFLLMLLSCGKDSMYDDFFKIECEKENTCSVIVKNEGDIPIYVDVTYTDSIPNQKRLIYPNESFIYKDLQFGKLVAWASIKSDCGWRAEGIYVAKCMEYEMSWAAVIVGTAKSLKISGE